VAAASSSCAYFFFLAGFFAAAFFVAIRAPPPFDYLDVLAAHGIAEFVKCGKCSTQDFFDGVQDSISKD
jgi:hypothetical protein